MDPSALIEERSHRGLLADHCRQQRRKTDSQASRLPTVAVKTQAHIAH
jgi:hypothetical protein